MKCKFSILFMLSLLSFITTRAQVDPHFSQYYVYPSWLNPALTGAFDGDYRVSGIYRNQWNSIGSPFSTPGASFEITTEKNINFGGSILNQTAGNGGYNYLTGYASAAYTGVKFGVNGNQRFVFALQAGVINRRFNPSKFTLGDQWNPVTGFNPNPSSDLPTKNKSMVFDAGAGVLYFDANPNQKANVYLGFSASHLNQPEDAFAGGASKEKLPMRFTAHGGVKININDMWSFTPNLLYLRQGTASEKMVGGYAKVKVMPSTDFMFGANYRFDDAISPYVGFNHNNMVIGASYDINTSDLGKMVRGTSSFEISISFIGRKSVKIPEEHFVCPRL